MVQVYSKCSGNFTINSKGDIIKSRMLTWNIASAVVFNKKNNLLILKRSKKNKHFTGYWQLPEGKIEENESSKDAKSTLRFISSNTNIVRGESCSEGEDCA